MKQFSVTSFDEIPRLLCRLLIRYVSLMFTCEDIVLYRGKKIIIKINSNEMKWQLYL